MMPKYKETSYIVRTLCIQAIVNQDFDYEFDYFDTLAEATDWANKIDKERYTEIEIEKHTQVWRDKAAAGALAPIDESYEVVAKIK